VAADSNGLLPAGDAERYVLAQDGLAEDGAVEDVADGAVGRLPHLLEVKLLDTGLIGGDGGALDADLFACAGPVSNRKNRVWSEVVHLHCTFGLPWRHRA